MSESKQDCNLCNKVGTARHDEICPRSAVRQRLLVLHLDALAEPRILWMQGFQAFKKRGSNTIHHAVNPGLPFVAPGRGKPWTAGGVPRGKMDECVAFRDALGIK
jgi:hypothetical protein